jgi:DNA-binding transcriptional MocR family regulator
MTSNQPERLDAARVARMMLGLGKQPGPLHRQVSQALRTLIDRGDLPVHALLPSERSLANAISVSRTTVVAAFDALRADGLIQSRQGSGTFVSGTRMSGARSPIVIEDPYAGEHPASRFLLKPAATVDFSSAAPKANPLLTPQLLARAARLSSLPLTQHGYFPRGLPELREKIASAYTDSGVPTDAEEVLVTSGVQPALELIIAGCLRRGELVLLEDPTYRGAIGAFRRLDIRARTVSVGPSGPDLPALEAELQSDDPPRMLYLQSTVHSPTGVQFTADKKRQLARLMERYGVLVVDDCALAGTSFESRPPLPLAAYSKSDRLFTIGSMSKLYWGGLRVGWIRAGAPEIARLSQLNGRVDLGTSVLSQVVSLPLLDLHHEAREARREELMSANRALTGALREQLPDWRWQAPQGGASLWVELPNAVATRFTQVALRFGVGLVPGPMFSVNAHFENFVRMPLTPSLQALELGVAGLAEAWRSRGWETSSGYDPDLIF